MSETGDVRDYIAWDEERRREADRSWHEHWDRMDAIILELRKNAFGRAAPPPEAP